MPRSKSIQGVRASKKLLMANVTPEYISVDDAEVMTGVSRWTWRKFSYEGKVTSCKVGTGRNARLLIPLSEVRRVLAEGTRPRVDNDEASRTEARAAY